MKHISKDESYSSIYRQIERSRLTGGERQMAITAMQNGAAFASAIMWVVEALVGGRERPVALKPSLKH
jgi:hypothetical protein